MKKKHADKLLAWMRGKLPTEDLTEADMSRLFDSLQESIDREHEEKLRRHGVQPAAPMLH